MNIYSYFADIPQLDTQNELRLSALWRRRWELAGFEPVVLGPWHARQHPMYDRLVKAVSNRPTINAQGYEVACFVRWLALAMAGGGYMADLDVMPYPTENGLALPEMTGAQLGNLQVYQKQGVCPSLAWAMPDTCDQLANVFLEGKLGRRDQKGREHWSDQYTIEDLVMEQDKVPKKKLANRALVVEVHDVVRCYSSEGWETAPVVHFANAYMGKHQPRWQHIPMLRK